MTEPSKVQKLHITPEPDMGEKMSSGSGPSDLSLRSSQAAVRVFGFDIRVNPKVPAGEIYCYSGDSASFEHMLLMRGLADRSASEDHTDEQGEEAQHD